MNSVIPHAQFPERHLGADCGGIERIFWRIYGSEELGGRRCCEERGGEECAGILFKVCVSGRRGLDGFQRLEGVDVVQPFGDELAGEEVEGLRPGSRRRGGTVCVGRRNG